MKVIYIWELKVIYIWELLVKTNLEGYAIYTSTTVMAYNAVPAQVSKNITLRNRSMKFQWASYRAGDGVDNNNGQKKGTKDDAT